METIDITPQLKNNTELVGLLNDKFEGIDWTAWINPQKQQVSIATWNGEPNGKNFRRDYDYDTNLAVEEFVEKIIADLKTL